ncbi:la-related protein 6b isoform X2 [Erpetoichthys calabaricus]|uniref:la-related protein 6b isoform X2 n=1 Tax=Erpetoichthys calabaricus TaxID=27687 RepID=UPI00109FE0C4|nr:la-related protein 6b isoform X2 [Erpetoichthys calabaricus]
MLSPCSYLTSPLAPDPPDQSIMDSSTLQICTSLDDCFLDSMDSSCDYHEIFEDEPYDGSDWRPPDEELARKIASQVECYLSDENLAEDAFLLKHVRRNKLGYVSIKLITSFKKVKYLTRDWRATRHALSYSRILEVNEEGTKVRRREPVSESLLAIPPSKILLAWNLQDDSQVNKPSGSGQICTMEKTMAVFGKYGNIGSLRILRPGKELPMELKKYAFKYPELGTKVCALVEYEFLEGARKAYEGLKVQQHAGSGEDIKVVLVGGRGTRKKNSSLGAEESEDLEETLELLKQPKKPGSRSKRFPFPLEDSSVYSSSESDFTPGSPVPIRTITRPQALYGSPLASPRMVSSFRPNSFSSPLASPVLPRKLFTSGACPSPLATMDLSSSPGLSQWPTSGSSPEGPKKSEDFSCDSGILVGSPWVHRRKMAAFQASSEKLACTSTLSRKLPLSTGLPTKLIRQPLGPDGTKGFYNCIGRGKLVLRH